MTDKKITMADLQALGCKHSLEQLKKPDIDSQNVVRWLFQLGKARCVESQPVVETYLTHEDTLVRIEALKVLVRYFKQFQYWQTAYDFLMEDERFTMQMGAVLLGEIMEDTDDPHTLGILARVVRDEQRESLSRTTAYQAMRYIHQYNTQEQFALTGQFIEDVPVDWDWVDACIRNDPGVPAASSNSAP